MQFKNLSIPWIDTCLSLIEPLGFSWKESNTDQRTDHTGEVSSMFHDILVTAAGWGRDCIAWGEVASTR